ncbi:hypothetical protein [Oleiphilus messinensis]|uniref:hypothetical protein n=1 Tax=Oleiphilus messinensis TaxID=141451 RepID=UPI000B3B9CDD|nr:hypothetical protein [Oleiphilus messinensis]
MRRRPIIDLNLEDDDGSPVKSLSELSREYPDLPGLRQQALAEEQAQRRYREEIEADEKQQATDSSNKVQVDKDSGG